MARTTVPKNYKKCALCKRWEGDAGLIYDTGSKTFKFDTGVRAKCAANGSMRESTNGDSCKDFAPSVEASRAL